MVSAFDTVNIVFLDQILKICLNATPAIDRKYDLCHVKQVRKKPRKTLLCGNSSLLHFELLKYI
jgi:hypothetical protein